MARILSIDYGSKRTGIAVTDPQQIIAGGLCTVPTSELMDFLRSYTARESVGLIVIGEPRQSDGSPSGSMAGVRAFVRRWRREMRDIPVVTYDERFTSVIAHKVMIDGGLKKKARRDKALVDEISATIILEDYLSSRQRREEPEPGTDKGDAQKP